MAEFIIDLAIGAVEALVKFICVQTAGVVLPIVSFGTLTTQLQSPHPPAYDERRPIFVGPVASTLFGLVFWAIVIFALVAAVR